MTPRTAPRDPRWLALTVLCAGTLMTILDAAIVTVALPSIERDLGFSQPNLAWVVNAYLIAFGGLLLLAGRLGDLGGRKRVFIAGLTVFTAASLWCGLAFLPITVTIAAVSLGLAPRFSTRFGPRAMLLTGLPLLVAGLALLNRAAESHAGSVTRLLPVLVVLGIGAGFALPAVMALVMSDVTAADSGVVSGLANTTQQVGGAVGVAVAATLATYPLAFAVGAGLNAAALVVAAVALRPRPAAPRPTPRTPAGRPTDCRPDPRETRVPARCGESR
jgi:MFS family permease